MNINTYVLDGDNIRHGLSSDLGFNQYDRKENIRRISEVANILNDAGFIVIFPAISPFKDDRIMAKKIIKENKFIEIFCNCDLKTCENRDTKGLYKLAKQGKIKNFTGISSPYQEPENPNLIVNTSIMSADDSANRIVLNKIYNFFEIEENELSTTLNPGSYPKYVGNKIDKNRDKNNIDYLTNKMKEEVIDHLEDIFSLYYPESL